MRSCILLGLVVAVSVAAGQVDSVKDELKKLEGKWAQVSVEADGKKLTDKQEAPKVTVTIRGEKWVETPAGSGDGDESTIKIDPEKKPKRIDLAVKLGDKTVTFPGIYSLDGDTLTTAVPFPFEGDFSNIGKRPGQLKTKKGDGFIVTIYKRVKP